MKNPKLWSKEDLFLHLQHALDLELWTIPLYLTSLYSIKGLKKQAPKNYPKEAKLIYSIVVQEMLHLELVGNICNALGFSPKFKTPVYLEEEGIPFIHPNENYMPDDLKGYHIKPQALNKDSLKLFCAIELPHPKNLDPWETMESYDSISVLYDALKVGIVHLWDECYIGDTLNTKQKDNFNEYHNTDGKNHGFSQSVRSIETAILAIDAIVAQGEGADTEMVPLEFRPNHDLIDSNSPNWYYDDLSHYQKFRKILHHIDTLPPVYDETQMASLEASQNCIDSFNEFLKELELYFNQEGQEMSADFWKKMIQLSQVLIQEWELGRCPKFS